MNPAEPVTEQVKIPTPLPLPGDLRMDASPRQQADLGIYSEFFNQLVQSQSRIANGIAALTQGMIALLQGRQSPPLSVRTGPSLYLICMCIKQGWVAAISSLILVNG